MGPGCPVCIPLAILCAKLPCVVPLWCFPCFPWRVQLGEVPWPYLTCPIATAIAWSPAGISIHWFGGYRSEDNDAGDVFWKPLLRSVNECVLEPMHLPDFLSIHLLFWEGWSPGVSLHQLLGEQIVMKCCPPASRNLLSDSWFDSWVGQRCQNQQAASTNSFKVYDASIKNTTSSQRHPKSSFVAKCLSSVHNVCKLDGSTYPGPLRRGKVLPRGVCHHVIAVFLFVFFSDPSIFPHLVCGRVWLMALWQRWSIIHHQGAWHEYALWDKAFSATRHKLDSHSFRSIILTNLSARIFAVISWIGCTDHCSKDHSSLQWLRC